MGSFVKNLLESSRQQNKNMHTFLYKNFVFYYIYTFYTHTQPPSGAQQFSLPSCTLQDDRENDRL